MHVNQHSLGTMFDSHGPANILVVDDVSQNLKLLSDMLIDAGHTVRPARTGRIAIESARRQPPDLVLLDIRMPEMDGFEICRQLKANPTTAAVPIIFISALEDSQDKVRAFEAGGVDYITKPFQQSEVLSRVHTHLALGAAHKKLETMVARRTKQLMENNRALRLLSKSLSGQKKSRPFCMPSATPLSSWAVFPFVAFAFRRARTRPNGLSINVRVMLRTANTLWPLCCVTPATSIPLYYKPIAADPLWWFAIFPKNDPKPPAAGRR